ncbi:pentapeptide repeat-containing protein [Variovorax sp. 770b2]|uniref:pentapeptide repeat-containing protein n=1 Tax=Variovorax sp. 770b2 TaxID=1566271 RepID=UPI0015A5DCC5|nr:pentapeptide repeat-containing protein [Variovorax sp. 770b2]
MKLEKSNDARPRGLRQRWSEPTFHSYVIPLVRQLLEARELHGHADLRGMVMAADGAIDELTSANLFEVKMSDVDLSGALLATSMSSAKFLRVRFDNATLDRVLAKKAVFEACSFAGSKLTFQADDAVFNTCDMSSARFLGTGSLQEWGARRAKFTNCDLTDALFKRVEFRACEFDNCKFDGCVFERCDLRGAKFLGALPVLKDCTV